MRNRKIAFHMMPLVGLLLCSHEAPAKAPTGPVYYLSPTGNDTNSGSATAPWRTIQKAANTATAGATVILLDGSYEEPSVNFPRSGTADKRITFKAQNKWKAIVSSTSGCNPGFSIKASYVTIKDIRFSVSPRNVTCAKYTSANVAIRAWNSIDPTPSNPNTGYVGFIADGVKVDAGLERSEGLKSNQDFSIIENSEVGSAIIILNNKNSIIRNNVIVDQDLYGVSILAKGGVRNAQIYGNVVHNKFPNGLAIAVGGYSCDACHFDTTNNMEAYNSVAYNNVVINESSGDVAALILQGAKDSAFYNNVVIGGQLSIMLGGHNTGPQAPSVNPTFKNNIVICNGKSVQSARGWSGNYNGSLNVDYNNFYNCAGTLAQAHPITGNPMFVNQTSDWRLQAGSPALNTGTPVSFTGYDGAAIDVARDRNGTVRTAPWDLGMYNQ